MAVALSLLIVLPTLAQVSGDRTDGKLSVGSWIDVRVAANLDDLDKTAASPDGAAGPETIASNATSYAVDGFDARDTYFNGDLYISNGEDAFNTVLITARVTSTTTGAVGVRDGKTDNIVSQLSGPDGIFGNDDADTGPGGTDADGKNTSLDDQTCADGAAVATIKNDRSGTSVKAYLRLTNDDDESVAGTPVNIYQGIAAVWDQEDEDGAEPHYGPCEDAQTDPTRYAGSERTDRCERYRSRTRQIKVTRTSPKATMAGQRPAARSSPHATATPSPSR